MPSSDPVSLGEIRAAIDEADTLLLRALAARFHAVAFLKGVKKAKKLPTEDVMREEVLKKRWKTQAREYGVPEHLALLMLDLILAESKKIQEQSS